MFNGVTNIPSMPAFNALRPWSLTSNFGGQLQFNYQDMSTPPQIAYMAQNCINPTFWANYNLANTSMPIMPFTGNDFMNQQAINNAYQQGYQLGERLNFQESVQTAGRDINTLKQEINKVLSRKDLPADKKQALETIKKKIEELEKQYKEFAKNSKNADMQKLNEELEAIRGELLALKEAATEIVETLPEVTSNNGTGSADDNGTANGTGNGTGSGAASGTANGTNTGAANGAGNGTPTTPAELDDEKTRTYQLNQACVMLDKAIDGPGTDYDGEQGMKTVLEAFVTPDNVVELWSHWDKTYGQQGSYKDDEDGFIETLMDECEFGQKEEIATILINAMEIRALQKGIDVATELAAARSAAKSNWLGWSNSDKIQETMKALYNKLK